MSARKRIRFASIRPPLDCRIFPIVCALRARSSVSHSTVRPGLGSRVAGAEVEALQHSSRDDGLAGAGRRCQTDGSSLAVLDIVPPGPRKAGEELVDSALLVVLQRELHRTPPSTLTVKLDR